MPTMMATSRQTLSLCFAIFIALDYFLGMWKGLGCLANKYYQMVNHLPENELMLVLIIIFTGVVGVVQVLLNNLAFRKLVEFRKHY